MGVNLAGLFAGKRREEKKHLWERYALLNSAHLEDESGGGRTSPPTQKNSAFLYLGTLPLGCLWAVRSVMQGPQFSPFLSIDRLRLTMVPPIVF